MSLKNNKTSRTGAVLLVVLFIIMAITIVSLGFLSRSDVELACGANMTLRTQMDYLAESGLEHARGLILDPQDLDSEYWTGAKGQQLVEASGDYYDVEVMRDSNDRCNYTVDCNAYRLKGGEQVGRSSLKAQLRLDPCIALWTSTNTALWPGVTIKGDVRCGGGGLLNQGTIDGDVFADAMSGSITGQQMSVTDLSLVWPRVTVADFTSHYTTQTISSGTLSGQTLGPYNPVRVCYSNGDLTLAGNVQIDGMLIVDGDLSVQGNSNIIKAAKNLPALLVTGDLIVASRSTLDVNGLGVVDDRMHVSADAANVIIGGGLFLDGGFVETTPDASSNGNNGAWAGISSYAPGIINQALSLDGTATGSYVVVDHHSVLDGMSELTLCAWAKKNVADVGGNIFTKHTVYYFEVRANRISAYLFNSIGIRLDLMAISDSISDTQWHHYALTYDGTAAMLYIDAQPAGPPQLLSGNIAVRPTRDLYIGKNPWGKNFNGLIDDVRIYNRALDVTGIQQAKEGHAVAGVVGHWKLDDSGSNLVITAAPARTAILIWSEAGDIEKWGQAAGAFFRSIERQ